MPGQCVATEAASWLNPQRFLGNKISVSGTLRHVITLHLQLGPMSVYSQVHKPIQARSSCSFPILMFSLLPTTPAVLPDQPEAGLEDERCPLVTGCDRAGGQCVCDARHSCLGSFSYPDQETCMKASKSGEALLSPSITHMLTRKIHTHIHTSTEVGDNAVH